VTSIWAIRIVVALVLVVGFAFVRGLWGMRYAGMETDPNYWAVADPAPVAPSPSAAAPEVNASVQPQQSEGVAAPALSQRVDPKSREYLDLVTYSVSRGDYQLPGAQVYLMSYVEIPKVPGYDPTEDLDKIQIFWRQESGPQVEIQNPNSKDAFIYAPGVSVATELVFVLEVSNESGSRSAFIRVQAEPLQSPS